MEDINRERGAMFIVLICLVAGTVEVGTFTWAVNTAGPGWGLALTASRAGILTGLICTVSSVIGLRHKPKWFAIAISDVGLVIGVLGLLVGLFIEAISHSCLVCM